MSGFRKFRSSLHRRRRSIEAELGFFLTNHPQDTRAAGEAAATSSDQPMAGGEAEAAPLGFSPSLEARGIGPAPIAWLRPKRPDTDN